MSWIVIVTPLEGAGDFDVVGAFADKEDAITWMQRAFHMPIYENYLFRIKELRAAAPALTAGTESDALEPAAPPPGD
jgi:hypothetical protein